jgi:DNA polymerase I
MPERVVAVIDGNSLVHRAFHALPTSMTAPDGRPTNAVFGFVSMLAKMVADLRPYAVVVAFDKGKPAFRTEILERYKVQRPPMADELRVQFPMLREVLAALDVPMVDADGWEGDDILGTLAERAKACGLHALLVTGDRDALQLVEDGAVSVVSTRKGITDIVVYDEAGVREKTGVTPAQIPDYLGLKGDTSDNIPGVPGVGEKTAAKLIQQYGSLEETLAHAGEIKGKLGESLRDNADEARASKLVATIRRDVPIEIDLEAVRWGTWRTEDVLRAFTALRFATLTERVFATVPTGSGAMADLGGVSMDVLEGEIVTETAEPATAARPRAEGHEAVERLRAWLQATPEAWLGVAVDDGAGETLFPEEGLTLAVAAPDETVLAGIDDAAVLLPALLASARVAAADAKAVLQAVCPAGAPVACPHPLDAVDPSRLFGCDVAAYLLESNRSSYDVERLAEEYLNRRIPAEGDAPGRAAAKAEAAAELQPLLAARLEADGSTECFERIEMPLVPVLVRMENVGVGVDTAVLASIAEEMAGQIDSLRAEITGLAGYEFNVDSPKQLGEILFEKLQLPAGKRTKTGWSTDASVLGTLAPSYPICSKVIEYRELTKLKSTYVDALPRLLGADGRLHTTFNQTVAATGRLSSSNPNLQNIPVRSELGRRIRAAFVPPDAGDLMVTADYSQIELRILAHLSQDRGLIDAFTSGQDFHTATASRVFSVEPDAVDAEMRRRAKAVNFGIVYGISAHGLSESLGVGRAEAQAMIDRYFAAYPQVREYLDRVIAEAHREGWAVTLFGRKRHIPELASSNFNLRGFGERTAMNHPMQGTAADIIKLAMVEVDRRMRAEGFAARMVLQVHDELVFEAPPAEYPRLAALVVETMGGVAELAVPLEVHVSSGPNWTAAK